MVEWERCFRGGGEDEIINQKCVFRGGSDEYIKAEKRGEKAKINEKFLGGVKNRVNTIVEKLISIVER